MVGGPRLYQQFPDNSNRSFDSLYVKEKKEIYVCKFVLCTFMFQFSSVQLCFYCTFSERTPKEIMIGENVTDSDLLETARQTELTLNGGILFNKARLHTTAWYNAMSNT